MIVEDNLVEELVEGDVGVVRAGVDTNSGVLVLDSRVDASLESNTLRAFHILVLHPDFLGKAIFELRFAFRREEGFKVIKFVRTIECLI